MTDLSYIIDYFRPDDAPGVVALFHHVYGTNFPVKEVYNPDELIRQERCGEAYRLVARSSYGEVVGHISLYRSTPPNPTLYEAGCLMVQIKFRKTPLSFGLITALKTMLIERHGVHQIWFEAVCNHLFTQQEACRLGLSETALEMDLMPACAYTTQGVQSVGGRVSTLTSFLLLSKESQTLYLPQEHEEFIRQIYAPLSQVRQYLLSDPVISPSGKTRGQHQIYTDAGLARITIEHAGADLPEWIEYLIHGFKGVEIMVMQVFFKLSSPDTGWIVDHLNSLGFFIGGILPVWFGEDALLMQKISGKPFFEGTHVYTKQAKMIKEYVHNDWQKICSM